MISAEDAQLDRPQMPQDAHDLQLRFYREIGISAVAAALNVSGEGREPAAEPSLAEVPAVLRADDLAA